MAPETGFISDDKSYQTNDCLKITWHLLDDNNKEIGTYTHWLGKLSGKPTELTLEEKEALK